MGWCERTVVFNMDPVLLALPVTLVSCVKGFCIDTLIRIWSHYPRGNTTMVNLVFFFVRCLLGILVQIQLQVFCVVPKTIIFSSTVFHALGWKSRASAMVLQVDEISNVHAVCLHCVAEARILHLPSAPDVPAASTSSAEELFATMPDLSFSCSSIAGPARHGPHKFAIKSLMVSTK